MEKNYIEFKKLIKMTKTCNKMTKKLIQINKNIIVSQWF